MDNDITKQLIIDEGMRKKPYQCSAGFWTIGVGRNLEDRGLTGDELKQLLDTKQIQLSITQEGGVFLL